MVNCTLEVMHPLSMTGNLKEISRMDAEWYFGFV